MACLDLSRDLDTRIDAIDSRYKHIVEYINEPHEWQSTPDRAKVGNVIQELVNYIVFLLYIGQFLALVVMESENGDPRTAVAV